MFERLKNKIFLSGLICGISLFSVDISYAQTKNIDYNNPGQAVSAMQFAEDHGGGAYVDVLNNDTNSSKILCGDENTICDRNTQICLKCEYSEEYYSSSTHRIETRTMGRCAPKNSPISWPDCKNINYSTQRKTPGTVTEQPTGFIISTNINVPFAHFEVQSAYFGNNKEFMLVIDKDRNLTIGYAKEKEFAGCEVLPVKLYNMQGCFFCPLAAAIFSSANDITEISFNNFASSFAKLLIIVFAIWLAIVTLNQVSSFTKQDTPKFISALIKQGFKVAVAFVLLTNANDLFSYFINPLLSSGMTLGSKIQVIQVGEVDKVGENITPPPNYEKNIITSSKNFFNIKPQEGEHSLYEKIELYLAYIQYQLSYMQSIGSSLFCIGSHKISIIEAFKNLDGVIDGLRIMFLGAIMLVFGFLLTISFGFYFLDAILQLAIIGAMLPLMIAGWPFKHTAQYASTGFKMLLNTFFVMFFTGFVISVNIQLINEALSFVQNPDLQENGGLDAIAKAITEQNFASVDKLTSIGGTGFLLLAFSFLFGFKFVAKTSELANTLAAGGLKGGISSRIGTMGASFAKGAALKLTKPLREAASAGFHKAGGVVGMASGLTKGTAELAGAAASKIGWKGGAKFMQGTAKVAGKAKNLSQRVHSVYRDSNK